MSDTRIVYGAGCLWWDDIHKVVQRGGLPTCPHCGSVLFEVPDLATWEAGAKKFEEAGHPGYFKLLTFMRGKCFKTMDEAKAAFAAADAAQKGEGK